MTEPKILSIGQNAVSSLPSLFWDDGGKNSVVSDTVTLLELGLTLQVNGYTIRVGDDDRGEEKERTLLRKALKKQSGSPLQALYAALKNSSSTYDLNLILSYLKTQGIKLDLNKILPAIAGKTGDELITALLQALGLNPAAFERGAEANLPKTSSQTVRSDGITLNIGKGAFDALPALFWDNGSDNTLVSDTIALLGLGLPVHIKGFTIQIGEDTQDEEKERELLSSKVLAGITAASLKNLLAELSASQIYDLAKVLALLKSQGGLDLDAILPAIENKSGDALIEALLIALKQDPKTYRKDYTPPAELPKAGQAVSVPTVLKRDPSAPAEVIDDADLLQRLLALRKKYQADEGREDRLAGQFENGELKIYLVFKKDANGRQTEEIDKYLIAFIPQDAPAEIWEAGEQNEIIALLQSYLRGTGKLGEGEGFDAEVDKTTLYRLYLFSVTEEQLLVPNLDLAEKEIASKQKAARRAAERYAAAKQGKLEPKTIASLAEEALSTALDYRATLIRWRQMLPSLSKRGELSLETRGRLDQVEQDWSEEIERLNGGCETLWAEVMGENGEGAESMDPLLKGAEGLIDRHAHQQLLIAEYQKKWTLSDFWRIERDIEVKRTAVIEAKYAYDQSQKKDPAALERVLDEYLALRAREALFTAKLTEIKDEKENYDALQKKWSERTKEADKDIKALIEEKGKSGDAPPADGPQTAEDARRELEEKWLAYLPLLDAVKDKTADKVLITEWQKLRDKAEAKTNAGLECIFGRKMTLSDLIELELTVAEADKLPWIYQEIRAALRALHASRLSYDRYLKAKEKNQTEDEKQYLAESRQHWADFLDKLGGVYEQLYQWEESLPWESGKQRCRELRKSLNAFIRNDPVIKKLGLSFPDQSANLDAQVRVLYQHAADLGKQTEKPKDPDAKSREIQRQHLLAEQVNQSLGDHPARQVLISYFDAFKKEKDLPLSEIFGEVEKAYSGLTDGQLEAYGEYLQLKSRLRAEGLDEDEIKIRPEVVALEKGRAKAALDAVERWKMDWQDKLDQGRGTLTREEYVKLQRKYEILSSLISNALASLYQMKQSHNLWAQDYGKETDKITFKEVLDKAVEVAKLFTAVDLKPVCKILGKVSLEKDEATRQIAALMYQKLDGLVIAGAMGSSFESEATQQVVIGRREVSVLEKKAAEHSKAVSAKPVSGEEAKRLGFKAPAAGDFDPGQVYYADSDTGELIPAGAASAASEALPVGGYTLDRGLEKMLESKVAVLVLFANYVGAEPLPYSEFLWEKTEEHPWGMVVQALAGEHLEVIAKNCARGKFVFLPNAYFLDNDQWVVLEKIIAEDADFKLLKRLQNPNASYTEEERAEMRDLIGRLETQSFANLSPEDELLLFQICEKLSAAESQMVRTRDGLDPEEEGKLKTCAEFMRKFGILMIDTRLSEDYDNLWEYLEAHYGEEKRKEIYTSLSRKDRVEYAAAWRTSRACLRRIHFQILGMLPKDLELKEERPPQLLQNGEIGEYYVGFLRHFWHAMGNTVDAAGMDFYQQSGVDPTQWIAFRLFFSGVKPAEVSREIEEKSGRVRIINAEVKEKAGEVKTQAAELKQKRSELEEQRTKLEEELRKKRNKEAGDLHVSWGPIESEYQTARARTLELQAFQQDWEAKNTAGAEEIERLEAEIRQLEADIASSENQAGLEPLDPENPTKGKKSRKIREVQKRLEGKQKTSEARGEARKARNERQFSRHVAHAEQKQSEAFSKGYDADLDALDKLVGGSKAKRKALDKKKKALEEAQKKHKVKTEEVEKQLPWIAEAPWFSGIKGGETDLYALNQELQYWQDEMARLQEKDPRQGGAQTGASAYDAAEKEYNQDLRRLEAVQSFMDESDLSRLLSILEEGTDDPLQLLRYLRDLESLSAKLQSKLAELEGELPQEVYADSQSNEGVSLFIAEIKKLTAEVLRITEELTALREGIYALELEKQKLEAEKALLLEKMTSPRFTESDYRALKATLKVTYGTDALSLIARWTDQMLMGAPALYGPDGVYLGRPEEVLERYFSSGNGAELTLETLSPEPGEPLEKYYAKLALAMVLARLQVDSKLDVPSAALAFIPGLGRLVRPVTSGVLGTLTPDVGIGPEDDIEAFRAYCTSPWSNMGNTVARWLAFSSNQNQPVDMAYPFHGMMRGRQEKGQAYLERKLSEYQAHPDKNVFTRIAPEDAREFIAWFEKDIIPLIRKNKKLREWIRVKINQRQIKSPLIIALVESIENGTAFDTATELRKISEGIPAEESFRIYDPLHTKGERQGFAYLVWDMQIVNEYMSRVSATAEEGQPAYMPAPGDVLHATHPERKKELPPTDFVLGYVEVGETAFADTNAAESAGIKAREEVQLFYANYAEPFGAAMADYYGNIPLNEYGLPTEEALAGSLKKYVYAGQGFRDAFAQYTLLMQFNILMGLNNMGADFGKIIACLAQGDLEGADQALLDFSKHMADTAGSFLVFEFLPELFLADVMEEWKHKRYSYALGKLAYILLLMWGQFKVHAKVFTWAFNKTGGPGAWSKGKEAYLRKIGEEVHAEFEKESRLIRQRFERPGFPPEFAHGLTHGTGAKLAYYTVGAPVTVPLEIYAQWDARRGPDVTLVAVEGKTGGEVGEIVYSNTDGQLSGMRVTETIPIYPRRAWYKITGALHKLGSVANHVVRSTVRAVWEAKVKSGADFNLSTPESVERLLENLCREQAREEAKERGEYFRGILEEAAADPEGATRLRIRNRKVIRKLQKLVQKRARLALELEEAAGQKAEKIEAQIRALDARLDALQSRLFSEVPIQNRRLLKMAEAAHRGDRRGFRSEVEANNRERPQKYTREFGSIDNLYDAFSDFGTAYAECEGLEGKIKTGEEISKGRKGQAEAIVDLITSGKGMLWEFTFLDATGKPLFTLTGEEIARVLSGKEVDKLLSEAERKELRELKAAEAKGESDPGRLHRIHELSGKMRSRSAAVAECFNNQVAPAKIQEMLRTVGLYRTPTRELEKLQKEIDLYQQEVERAQKEIESLNEARAADRGEKIETLEKRIKKWRKKRGELIEKAQRLRKKWNLPEPRTPEPPSSPDRGGAPEGPAPTSERSGTPEVPAPAVDGNLALELEPEVVPVARASTEVWMGKLQALMQIPEGGRIVAGLTTARGELTFTLKDGNGTVLRKFVIIDGAVKEIDRTVVNLDGSPRYVDPPEVAAVLDGMQPDYEKAKGRKFETGNPPVAERIREKLFLFMDDAAVEREIGELRVERLKCGWGKGIADAVIDKLNQKGVGIAEMSDAEFRTLTDLLYGLGQEKVSENTRKYFTDLGFETAELDEARGKCRETEKAADERSRAKREVAKKPAAEPQEAPLPAEPLKTEETRVPQAGKSSLELTYEKAAAEALKNRGLALPEGKSAMACLKEISELRPSEISEKYKITLREAIALKGEAGELHTTYNYYENALQIAEQQGCDIKALRAMPLNKLAQWINDALSLKPWEKAFARPEEVGAVLRKLETEHPAEYQKVKAKLEKRLKSWRANSPAYQFVVYELGLCIAMVMGADALAELLGIRDPRARFAFTIGVMHMGTEVIAHPRELLYLGEAAARDMGKLITSGKVQNSFLKDMFRLQYGEQSIWKAGAKWGWKSAKGLLKCMGQFKAIEMANEALFLLMGVEHTNLPPAVSLSAAVIELAALRRIAPRILGEAMAIKLGSAISSAGAILFAFDLFQMMVVDPFKNPLTAQREGVIAQKRAEAKRIGSGVWGDKTEAVEAEWELMWPVAESWNATAYTLQTLMITLDSGGGDRAATDRLSAADFNQAYFEQLLRAEDDEEIVARLIKSRAVTNAVQEINQRFGVKITAEQLLALEGKTVAELTKQFNLPVEKALQLRQSLQVLITQIKGEGGWLKMVKNVQRSLAGLAEVRDWEPAYLKGGEDNQVFGDEPVNYTLRSVAACYDKEGKVNYGTLFKTAFAYPTEFFNKNRSGETLTIRWTAGNFQKERAGELPVSKQQFMELRQEVLMRRNARATLQLLSGADQQEVLPPPLRNQFYLETVKRATAEYREKFINYSKPEYANHPEAEAFYASYTVLVKTRILALRIRYLESRNEEEKKWIRAELEARGDTFDPETWKVFKYDMEKALCDCQEIQERYQELPRDESADAAEKMLLNLQIASAIFAIDTIVLDL